MWLFVIPFILLLYWCIDKYNNKKGNKAYRELQEKYKEMGLK